MAIEYTWALPTLERELADGGVIVALQAKIEADKNPTSTAGVSWE
jgi:hypothetical protein